MAWNGICASIAVILAQARAEHDGSSKTTPTTHGVHYATAREVDVSFAKADRSQL